MSGQIQLMAALCFFGIGLSMFLRPTAWVFEVEHLEQGGKREALKLGALNLLLGAFIIAFHPITEGLAAILTVVGALALLKGIIYLLCPGLLSKVLTMTSSHRKPMIMIAGLICLAISGTLFYVCSACTVEVVSEFRRT